MIGECMVGLFTSAKPKIFSSKSIFDLTDHVSARMGRRWYLLQYSLVNVHLIRCIKGVIHKYRSQKNGKEGVPLLILFVKEKVKFLAKLHSKSKQKHTVVQQCIIPHGYP